MTRINLSKKVLNDVGALFEGAYTVQSTMPCHSSQDIGFVVTSKDRDKPVSIHRVECLCGTKYYVRLHNVKRSDGTYTHSLVWDINHV